MPMFKIAIRPPIAENLRTYWTPSASKRLDEDLATSLRYGSILHDQKRGKMMQEWSNEESFLVWLATKELEHSIELIVSNIARSNLPLWQEWRIMKCLHEYTGGRPDQHSGASALEERNRKILSKKTGCWCCLTLKFYWHMEIILGNYKSEHDHSLRDKNLWFTQLTDRTRGLVMVMLTMGIEAKTIVSLISLLPSTELTHTSSLGSPRQLKHVCESTKQTNRDYYITMRDINCIQQIVEDEKICLDENDAISVKVWATWLQQEGASVILKDKIDAVPPESGLSPDTFIFCIQIAFQKDQYNLIGKDFLGIDDTHNTTQYCMWDFSYSH